MSSESDAGSRRRARHLGPQRRRPQVLDTALEIAVSEGLSAVTMASVADRMQVTRPVVYACFPDRAQLIEQLCRREEEHFVGQLLTTLPYGGLGDDASALTGSLQTLLRLTTARPQAWHFLTDAADAVLGQRPDRAADIIRRRCTALLETSLHEWGATGIERKTPVLVAQWLAAGEAAVRTMLTGPGDWTPDELGSYIGDTTYRMLRHA